MSRLVGRRRIFVKEGDRSGIWGWRAVCLGLGRARFFGEFFGYIFKGRFRVFFKVWLRFFGGKIYVLSVGVYSEV